MSNIKVGSDDISSKSNANTLTVALTISSDSNRAEYDAETARRANGAGVLSQSAYTALLLASECQRDAIVAIDNGLKVSLMKVFTVACIVSACVNSYSLKKLPSLALALRSGDWNTQTEYQFKVWAAKALDAENETEQREWCAMFSPSSASDLWDVVTPTGERKQIAKSPTQQNQCDTLAERLGMLTRHTDGGRSIVRWTKNDHKAWSILEAIFDAQFATPATGE